MKQLLLTLFVVLTLAVFSSVSFAQDRPTRNEFSDNWETTSQVFSETPTDYRWSNRVSPENRQSTSQVSSEVRSDDPSPPSVLPESRQTTSQGSSEARSDDPQVLNQGRGSAGNDLQAVRPSQQFLGSWERPDSFTDIYCANYEHRCCDASPVTEIRWCQWNSFNAARFGCPCQ